MAKQYGGRRNRDVTRRRQIFLGLSGVWAEDARTWRHGPSDSERNVTKTGGSPA